LPKNLRQRRAARRYVTTNQEQPPGNAQKSGSWAAGSPRRWALAGARIPGGAGDPAQQRQTNRLTHQRQHCQIYIVIDLYRACYMLLSVAINNVFVFLCFFILMFLQFCNFAILYTVYQSAIYL
jgi:hypothetical protein